MFKTNKNNRKDTLELRRSLRKNSTAEEAVLWKMLKSKQIENTGWRRQFSVGPFVLDFYCPTLTWAIELDGNNHFVGGSYEYDESRTKFLNAEGIHVLRFENYLIWESIDSVVEIIRKEILNRIEN